MKTTKELLEEQRKICAEKWWYEGEKLTPAEKQFCRVKTTCCNADIISKEIVDVDQSVKTIYICSKCLKELQ